MLRRLQIQKFKSLGTREPLDVPLGRMTVVFGPNASGKSNLLEAIQALSRIGTSRTLSEAFSDPIRGYPIEYFALPEEGLPGFLNQKRAELALTGDIDTGKQQYRYEISVNIRPASAELSILSENLIRCKGWKKTSNRPSIETRDDEIVIRRKIDGTPKVRREKIGLKYAVLSDARFDRPDFLEIARVRGEMQKWRVYYLDPRTAMRRALPPAEVDDIGVLGDKLPQFLYRLHASKPKHFDAAKRTLRALVPGVEDLRVDLDQRRGTLDIMIRQDGVEYSSRIMSEGTLRVLGLCALAVNPWSGSLIAFEEPENGVHPRRLEQIVDLLLYLAFERDDSPQVIVTTHSPIFCDCLLSRMNTHPNAAEILFLHARRRNGTSEIVRFEDQEELSRATIDAALDDSSREAPFQHLALRGLCE